MSTAIDSSIGAGVETTYGVGVTPTRFFEAADTFDKKLNDEKSSGVRPLKRVARSNRHVITKTEVSGDTTMDFVTRGLGFLLNAVLGGLTNTQVPSTTPAVFQQVHTLSTTDPLKSFTIQKGVPPVLGGPVVPITFTGCQADSLDLELKNTGIFTMKVGWVGKDASRTPSYAAPSYPADLGPLSNVDATIGLSPSSSLTAPTATALATGTTAATNIRDLSISVKNNLDGDGFNIGGAGTRTRPAMVGMAEITGKVTAEFDSTTLLDAYWNQTALALDLTLTHPVIISGAIKTQLEIVLPCIRLKGETPKASNDGKPVTQSIDFEAFDDGSGKEPIYVVFRTLDTTP